MQLMYCDIVGLDPLIDQDPLPWDYWRFGTADVNFDGKLLASDASDILKYSVGLIKILATSKR